ATEHGDGVSFLFTADRYFVIGDETLTATLEIWRKGKPLDAAITQAFPTVVDPVRHEERAVPLAFTPSGTRLASVFAPASLRLARESAIRLSVEFDYGDGRQRAHFDFQYTPTDGIPARFTGAFRDSLESGSLVIHAGIDVTTPGPYLIDA